MVRPWPTIEELRKEFLDNGLSGLLWELIADDLTVHGRARLASRYNPRIYSPSGAWDEEGLRDLINDFVVEQGIKKGAVLRALQQADNSAGFIYYLEASFRNYAVSQRQRTIADNLYRRLIDALADYSELLPLAGVSTRSAYGLRSWHDDPPGCLDEADMRTAMKAFPEDVRTVLYDSESRQSPLLQVNELQRIARLVITGTGKLVTAKQIMQLIRARFNIEPVSEPSQLESAESSIETDTQPLQAIIARELAGLLFSKLSARQRSVLRELIGTDPPPSVRDIARSLGTSKSVVQRERQFIIDAISSLDVREPHEQSQVLLATAQLVCEAS